MAMARAGQAGVVYRVRDTTRIAVTSRPWIRFFEIFRSMLPSPLMVEASTHILYYLNNGVREAKSEIYIIAHSESVRPEEVSEPWLISCLFCTSFLNENQKKFFRHETKIAGQH